MTYHGVTGSDSHCSAKAHLRMVQIGYVFWSEAGSQSKHLVFPFSITVVWPMYPAVPDSISFTPADRHSRFTCLQQKREKIKIHENKRVVTKRLKSLASPSPSAVLNTNTEND